MSNNIEKLRLLQQEEIRQNEENYIERTETNGQAISDEASPGMRYEEFFKESVFKKEKLVTLQVHQSVHQRLSLVKQVKKVNMTDFLEHIVEDWFQRNRELLKKDFNQLKKII